MTKDNIQKGGTYQSLPPSVYKTYKDGKLDSYLPKKRQSIYDTNEDIIKAYNQYNDIQNTIKGIANAIKPNDDKKSSKSEEENQLALWNYLHGSNFDPDKVVKEDKNEIVNTPLAYEMAVNAGVLPSQEQMNPYILTLDQNCSKPDYKALKKLGLMGVCIDIGCYFSVNHLPNNPFRQPKLDSQVKYCKENKIPYGLFTTVRSRSIQEANLELEEIKLAIRKYVPSLGFWLKLNLTQSVNTNNAIIARYYNELYKLGLKDQMGFYVTRDQLKKITWSKFYNHFYLWIDEHVSKLDDIPIPLTPEFFMVRGVS